MLRALTLVLALLTTAASANTLTEADVQSFYAFDQKAATLLQDISDAARALRPGGCLPDLANQLTFVVSEFKFVEAMAELEQESPAEDTEVRTTLLLRAVKFLSLLVQDRKAISDTMGLPSCAGNGVVAAKGKEIFRLCDEAGGLVVAISKKLK